MNLIYDLFNSFFNISIHGRSIHISIAQSIHTWYLIVIFIFLSIQAKEVQLASLTIFKYMQWHLLIVYGNHEIMTQKWKRKMYLQHQDLNRGPLELRASVLLMSYNGCNNCFADQFFYCIVMQLKLCCSNFVVKRFDACWAC